MNYYSWFLLKYRCSKIQFINIYNDIIFVFYCFLHVRFLLTSCPRSVYAQTHNEDNGVDDEQHGGTENRCCHRRSGSWNLDGELRFFCESITHRYGRRIIAHEHKRKLIHRLAQGCPGSVLHIYYPATFAYIPSSISSPAGNTALQRSGNDQFKWFKCVGAGMYQNIARM